MESRVILAIGVGAAIFLLLRRPASSAVYPPQVGEDRVMKYADWIWAKGGYYGVEPGLIASVMYVESRGDPGAIGAAGEVGLMQILPATALAHGVLDIKTLPQPDINIGAGTRYLRYLLDRYSDNVAASVAAYNAGPGRISVDSDTRLISAPTYAKKYALDVMRMVPTFRERFKGIPQYTLSYSLLFRPASWFLNFESFEGIGSLAYRL